MPCQLEPIITSFTLTTGHFTKYKSSLDMYNGIIFISIKCGFFGVFFLIKPHLYCTYVMHISGSFHYLHQFSFFCACHKLERSFPKQSQIVIEIIMVYTITHLINSMVTHYFPFDILMGIDYIPVLKLRKYQYFITNKTDKKPIFLGLVAMILYWHSGNQNIE